MHNNDWLILQLPCLKNRSPTRDLKLYLKTSWQLLLIDQPRKVSLYTCSYTLIPYKYQQYNDNYLK